MLSVIVVVVVRTRPRAIPLALFTAFAYVSCFNKPSSEKHSNNVYKYAVRMQFILVRLGSFSIFRWRR